jgi:hypothetical protein
VEHDLSVLDYLSDFICCLYGKPGAYGVVTLPFSVREGINIFLAGFVPTENLRFREESLTFKVTLLHKMWNTCSVMELRTHVSVVLLDRGDPGKCGGSCFVPAVQVPYHDQNTGKFQALCSWGWIHWFSDCCDAWWERHRENYIHQNAGISLHSSHPTPSLSPYVASLVNSARIQMIPIEPLNLKSSYHYGHCKLSNFIEVTARLSWRL